MGLLNNGYRHNLTGLMFGATNIDGGNPSVLRSFLKPAYQRNQLAGEGIESDFAAIPQGYLDGGAWVLPRKAGAMASVNNTELSISAAGAMLRGYPIEGSASFTIDTGTLTGELIVSGDGTASLTFATNNPLLTASIGGEGSTTITISTNTPILGAEASGSGEATITFSGSLEPYAIGVMEGTTEEAGLTNAGIANSVWSKVIEAGFTADQILRILAAHAAGSATGLEGANPQFTGLDGVTLRIDGAYTAGTRSIDFLDGE